MPLLPLAAYIVDALRITLLLACHAACMIERHDYATLFILLYATLPVLFSPMPLRHYFRYFATPFIFFFFLYCGIRFSFDA